MIFCVGMKRNGVPLQSTDEYRQDSSSQTFYAFIYKGERIDLLHPPGPILGKYSATRDPLTLRHLAFVVFSFAFFVLKFYET